MKYLFLLLLLVSCKNYEFAQPPDYEIVDDVNTLILRWNHAKGTDIAGYIIFYGEITRGVKPPSIGLVNNFRQIDVGYTNQYRFVIKSNTFYQFFMKSYDMRGNQSFASRVKYFPHDPNKGMFHTRINDPYDGYLYKTGEQVRLSWDAQADADYFEVKVHLINDDNFPAVHHYGTTTSNTILLNRPHGFVGLCEYLVSACSNESGLCSDWSSSNSLDGNVTINGESFAGKWILYWMLSAPSWL